MWKITTEKFKKPKEGGAYLSERTRIVPERHIHPKSVLIDLSKVDKDTASHIRKVIERHKGKAVTYGQITICVLFVIAITIGAVMDCANKDFYSLKLHNNIVAQNLSSVELITFLEQDPTNEHEVIEYRHKDCFAGNLPTDASRVGIYDESKSVLLGIETLYDYVTSGYMCINYATDLHNNAEKAGIRCAVADNNNGHDKALYI